MYAALWDIQDARLAAVHQAPFDWSERGRYLIGWMLQARCDPLPPSIVAIVLWTDRHISVTPFVDDLPATVLNSIESAVYLHRP